MRLGAASSVQLEKYRGGQQTNILLQGENPVKSCRPIKKAT